MLNPVVREWHRGPAAVGKPDLHLELSVCQLPLPAAEGVRLKGPKEGLAG